MTSITRAIFGRYIIGSFLLWFCFIACSLSALLMLFDMMANAEEVTAHHDAPLPALLAYVVLRLPAIITLALPLSCLLASMVVLIKKTASQEILMMQEAGIPFYRVASMFMIGALMVAALTFINMNVFQVDATQRLQAWQAYDYQGLPSDDGQIEKQHSRWLSAGTSLIKIGSASPDGSILYKVRLILRAPDSGLDSYIKASRAVYNEGGEYWDLEDVVRPALGNNGQNVRLERIEVSLPISPSTFSTLADRADKIGFFALLALDTQSLALDRPAYVYSVWLQRKIAYPLSCLIMVFLTLPLAQMSGRGQSYGRSVFFIVLAGFSFFITERFLQTIGEAGMLPPLVAAWSPLLLFLVIGLWFMLSWKR